MIRVRWVGMIAAALAVPPVQLAWDLAAHWGNSCPIWVAWLLGTAAGIWTQARYDHRRDNGVNADDGRETL